MPINKLALIRYKTIDSCLRNRQRRWTLEDLEAAVAESLYEFEGIANGVSRRTIQLDLQTMRSEKLGYEAPIIVVDKKYYTYEDPAYSIMNNPLTQQDMETLTEVMQVLRQFTGFTYFQDLQLMVSRLEDKLYKQTHKGRSFIHFEKNDLVKGLEFIDPVHKAILNENPVRLQYQSFRARQPTTFLFHPYLIKEHRNRWFVIGSRNAGVLLTLALDRVHQVEEIPDLPLMPNTIMDIETYYDDVIGVTKDPRQRPQLIVLRVKKDHAPYLLTKPLHSSQKMVKDEGATQLFTIRVIWNFELERDLLGFGELIEVISPRGLRTKMAGRLRDTLNAYQPKTAEPKD